MSNELELNKDRADADRYYKLFADKVGKIEDGERILFIHIGNFDVLDRFIQSNPNCSYYIIDQRLNGSWFEMNWDCKFIGTNEDDSIVKALESLNMKFDKIIMNPPYCGNLHLDILKEAKKHLNESGRLIDLSPIRFAQSLTNDKNEYSWLNNSILSLKRVSQAEAISLFQNRISFDLMVLTIGKNGKSLDDFNKYELRGLNPKLLFVWNKIQSKFTKATSFASFIKKPTEPLKKFSVIFNHMSALTNVHNHVYENGKFNGKKYIDYVKNQHKNETTDHFEFDSFEEADNFRKTIFTYFMKFLILSLKINERIIMRAIPWMGDIMNPRTGKKGYESEWTDEDFYKYFGITEDEQKLIEETMEKYK